MSEPIPSSGAPAAPPAGPSVPGAAAFGALPRAAQLVVAGAAIATVPALIGLNGGMPHTGALGLAAAAVGLAALFAGRGRPAGRWASIVLVAAAVLAVLSVLDLLALLSDLSDLEDYGGGLGLLGRAAYAAGGVLLSIGAVSTWRVARAAEARTALGGADRLALVGGGVVILAWVAMILAAGWVLVFDQAIGVAAATAAVAVLVARAGGTSPLGARPTVMVVIGLAALTAAMAINGILGVAEEWSFVVDVGGPSVYVPFLAYLAGAAMLAVAGALMARTLLAAPAPVTAEA